VFVKEFRKNRPCKSIDAELAFTKVGKRKYLLFWLGDLIEKRRVDTCPNVLFQLRAAYLRS